MTIRQLPAPKWTVPGHSGSIAAGWLVYTYEPTSSTPKDTYTDSSGDTSNQNPVELDSRGEADIWWDGNYKVIVKDQNDVTVWTVDNYGSGIEQIAAAQLSVVPNYSFETATSDPDLPDDWTVSTYTNGTAALDSSAGNQIHGAKALKFTSAGSGGGFATTEFFPVQEAVPVMVIFAMKGTADVRNLIEIIWYDKDQSLVSTTSLYDASSANPTSWTDQALPATPPSTARFAKIRLTGCHSSDATAGSTWFDNVRVTSDVVTTQGAQTISGVKTFSQSIANLVNSFCDGRLTLTTATAVTTSDVTAATTIYFTPFRGNRIALYDGSANWNVYTFSELSIAVPATTNQMYDVWCYNNNGSPALELLAWTNDTTRATALALQDGVYVKNGSTTRRYLGSFRTTGVSGQTEDSVNFRYLYNYYNRVDRLMRGPDETTDTWTHNTNTFRQANGVTTNKFEVVVGWSEDSIDVNVTSRCQHSGSLDVIVGVGVDSTTVSSAVFYMGHGAGNGGVLGLTFAHYSGVPAVGKHAYNWLEKGGSSGTSTFYGDGGTGAQLHGIRGRIRM